MFARRPVLERPAVQNALVAAALAISVFMLAPPVSPVLGERGELRLLWDRPGVAEEARFGTTAVDPGAFPKRKPAVAKGILLTGYTAGGSRFDDLLAFIERTELNAVVIDIKDERGEFSWVPTSPMARAAGAGFHKIEDPAKLVRRLKRAGVYVIGRIVTFQDPMLAEARPDLAVQDREGGIWRNEKGLAWLDPYSTEAQDYNIALAVEAVEAGFDEIQFDYVRFPSDGDVGRMWSRFADERPRHQVIPEFLARAREEVHARGAFISADLFGLVALVSDDLGIGQRLELIAREVDYVSLMLYPSHYNKPEYGIADPEKVPYETVKRSITDAKQRIAGSGAKLRPWLQDFTLRVPYTPVEVRQQIEAAQDLGVDEWLLWNARNRYSEDALRPARGQTKPPPPPEDSLINR